MKISPKGLIIMTALLSGVCAMAQNEITNTTKAYLDKWLNAGAENAQYSISAASGRSRSADIVARRGSNRQRQLTPHMVNGESRGATFVTIDNENARALLEAQDFDITASYGNVLTVDAPLTRLAQIAEIEGVTRVSVARNMRLKSDLQRSTANVDQVHAGTGLAMPYTGTGVVVGIIDVGIDYNHMAFKDANGKSRVVRVFKPSAYGTINIGGQTIQGVEYSTPEAIAKLSTDYNSESHGTHTSAIAAGTKVGNYGGMAPNADIVLCGMGDDLSDASILNAVRYVFAYAESEGKPAVVNLSLGDHAGAHDGTSDFCQALDLLTGDGKVCVAAAGNEGDLNIHFSTTFANEGTSAEQGTVVLSDSEYDGTYYEAAIDIWGVDNTAYTLQYVVMDADGTILTRSPKQTASASGSATFNMTSHSTFSTYYKGSATAYFGVDAKNNKYNVYVEVNAESVDANFGGYVGLLLYGPKGVMLNGWVVDEFTDIMALGKDGLIDGDSEKSISAMVTGENVISVGAFASKKSYKSISGQTWSYGILTEGNLASFSSYGPDANGIARPDVVGAGALVISAVNGYDNNTINETYLAAKATDAGGATHYWGDMMGTSMSSPQVAGIVALWLQANPQLSAQDIRTVMNNTSIRDTYVTQGEAKKWGAGKINALEGIKYVIGNSGIDDVVKPVSEVVIYPNPTDGAFAVYAPSEDRVTVTVYTIDGAMCYKSQIACEGGIANVDLREQLPGGVYVVTVDGEGVHEVTRLLKK